MSGLFGGSETSSQVSGSAQRGANISNEYATNQFQDARDSYYNTYNPTDIANSGALNANQTTAAGQLAGVNQNLLPAFGASSQIAQQGIDPNKIAGFQSAYTQGVIDPMRQVFRNMNQDAYSDIAGNMYKSGAGKNYQNVAGEQAKYAARTLPGQEAALAQLQENAYNQALGAAGTSTQMQNQAAATAAGLANAQTAAGSALGMEGERQRVAGLEPFRVASEMMQGAKTPMLGSGTSFETLGSSSSTGERTATPSPFSIFSNIFGLLFKDGGPVEGRADGGEVLPPYAAGGAAPEDMMIPAYGQQSLPGFWDGGNVPEEPQEDFTASFGDKVKKAGDNLNVMPKGPPPDGIAAHAQAMQALSGAQAANKIQMANGGTADRHDNFVSKVERALDGFKRMQGGGGGDAAAADALPYEGQENIGLPSFHDGGGVEREGYWDGKEVMPDGDSTQVPPSAIGRDTVKGSSTALRDTPAQEPIWSDRRSEGLLGLGGLLPENKSGVGMANLLGLSPRTKLALMSIEGPMPGGGKAGIGTKGMADAYMQLEKQRQEQATLEQARDLAMGYVKGQPTLAAQQHQFNVAKSMLPTWSDKAGKNRYGEDIPGWVNPWQAPGAPPMPQIPGMPTIPGVNAPPGAAVTPGATGVPDAATGVPTGPRRGQTFAPGVTPAFSEDSSAAPGQDLLTGEAFLRTLDPVDALQVKAILSGRAPAPSANFHANPRTARFLAWAAQAEPGFDLGKWQARNAAWKDFTAGGKTKSNLESADMLIGHLGGLYDSIEGLGNWGTPFGNFFREHGGNWLARETKITDFANREQQFNLKKELTLKELDKYLAGAGGSGVGERERLFSMLAASKSEAELKEAVKVALEMMGSRLNATAKKYNDAFDSDRTGRSFLSDESRKTLERLEHGVHGVPMAKEPTAQLPKPIEQMTAGEIAKLDPKTLSSEQLQQVIMRRRQLLGGGR